MDNTRDAITMDELCTATGESARTVRFYIVNGLLGGPTGSGPAARYPASNVDRLRIIRTLQDQGVQLSRIREVLEGRAAVDALASSRPAKGGLPSPSVEPAPVASTGEVATPGRSQWDRMELEPGVELHVRRPLGVAANRRVRRLIDLYLASLRS